MTDWLNNLNPGTQFALFAAVKAVAAFAVLMFMVAYIVQVERRVCAFIQDHIGPNRAGPFGLLQPAADAVKAFFKEERTPASSDPSGKSRKRCCRKRSNRKAISCQRSAIS